MSIPAGGSRASWKPGSGPMPATLPHTLQHVTIMAGRVPLSPDRQEMPDDLSQTLVGPASAREIGWTRH
jgi:hypothetical protein